MIDNDTVHGSPSPAEAITEAEAALKSLQIQSAVEWAHRAIGQCEQLQDPVESTLCKAHGLRILAKAHWQLGETTQAYACATRSLPVFEQLHDREHVIDLRDLAVLSLCGSGLAEDALPLARANVDLAAEPPQLFDLLSQSLSTLAHVYAVLGRHNDAELLHLQALSRARESSDAQTLARAYANILLTGAMAFDELVRKGQDAQARVVARRQLKFAHQARAHMDAPVMSTRQRAMLRLNIGLCLTHAGQLDEARQILEEGMSLVQAQGPEGLIHSLHLALGECALEAQDLRAAADHLEPLLEIQAQYCNTGLMPPLLRNSLRLRQAQGQPEAAERLAQQLSDLEADQAQCRARTHREIQDVRQRMLHLLLPEAPTGLTRF